MVLMGSGLIPVSLGSGFLILQMSRGMLVSNLCGSLRAAVGTIALPLDTSVGLLTCINSLLSVVFEADGL